MKERQCPLCAEIVSAEKTDEKSHHTFANHGTCGTYHSDLVAEGRARALGEGDRERAKERIRAQNAAGRVPPLGKMF